MTNNYKKISSTAVMVAYFRAKYTDMPFAKEIYEKTKQLSLILKIIAPTLTWLANFFPGTLERLSSFEGRYLAINEAIKKLGNNFAIIEVASGLSSRGLEWINKNFLYIETDLPEILEKKESIFNNIVKDENIKTNQNHIFLPLNVIDYGKWEEIGKKYFADKNIKIAIIHEGLISYFSKDEQVIFRDNIAKFLQTYSPNGAWITSDFALPRKMSESWIIKLGKKIIERDTKRKLNHFRNHQEVVDFLKYGNLEADVLDNTTVIESLTCVPKLKLNKEIIKEISKTYKVYFITLRKEFVAKINYMIHLKINKV